MTLTIKEPAALTSLDKPGSNSQNSEKKSAESPRSNPVCLEVSVTVRSLPGENNSASGPAGPVREEGRTVIVFDNGAVLKLSTNLPAGQTVILSNPQGRDVVCRVVNGQNLPTIKGYIEVEFIEAVNDFWRIHQTPETVNVLPPPIPALALPQQAPATPPLTSAAAQPTAPPVVVTEKESESPSGPLGSAPSFEDIAGLVSMSPSTATRAKITDTTAQASVPKSKTELTQNLAEPVKSSSAISGPGPIGGVTSVKSAIPATREFSPPPIQKSDSSHNFMSKGLLASSQMSSTTTASESRGRMPVILGGVALLLAGFGAGYFLMLRGNGNPSPATSASVQVTEPPTSGPVYPSEPVQAPSASVAQELTEVSVASAAVSVNPEAAISSEAQNPRRRDEEPASPEARQVEKISKQRQQIASLKMTAPSASSRNLARLPEGPVAGVTDVASAVAISGTPGAAMLSPVVRSESQPTAPPGIGSVPVSKTVREPKLINSPSPVYPPMARKSNIQGTVIVSAEVDLKGNVTGAKAISGSPLLQQAAIDAVKQWKYTPALIDGKPTPGKVQISVQFHLD